MSMNNWEGPEHEIGLGDIDLGTPDYENGEPIKLAFGLNRVFTTGIQVLKEQPVLALLAGFNILILAIVKLALTSSFDFAEIILETTGHFDPRVGGLIGQVASLAMEPVFLILNMLVLGGAYIAFANYIRNDEVSYSALYTSVIPALKGLVYGFLTAIIILVIIGSMLIPGALLLFGSPTVGLIVMLVSILISVPLAIYVNLGLMLGIFPVVLDSAGIIESMSLSWEAARGARGDLLILSIVFALLGLASTCCCLVPTIFVAAIQMAGMTAGWLKFARAETATEEWTFFQRLDARA